MTESTVVYVHSLQCLLCGRAVGAVTSSTEHGSLQVARSLRCLVCGGSPIPDGAIKRVITYPPVEYPRLARGRPRATVAAALPHPQH